MKTAAAVPFSTPHIASLHSPQIMTAPWDRWAYMYGEGEPMSDPGQQTTDPLA